MHAATIHTSHHVSLRMVRGESTLQSSDGHLVQRERSSGKVKAVIVQVALLPCQYPLTGHTSGSIPCDPLYPKPNMQAEQAAEVGERETGQEVFERHICRWQLHGSHVGRHRSPTRAEGPHSSSCCPSCSSCCPAPREREEVRQAPRGGVLLLLISHCFLFAVTFLKRELRYKPVQGGKAGQADSGRAAPTA